VIGFRSARLQIDLTNACENARERKGYPVKTVAVRSRVRESRAKQECDLGSEVADSCQRTLGEAEVDAMPWQYDK